jgi:hypothetical protein
MYRIELATLESRTRSSLRLAPTVKADHPMVGETLRPMTEGEFHIQTDEQR